MGGSATEKSFFWQERRSRFFGKVVWQRVCGFECKIHDGKLRIFGAGGLGLTGSNFLWLWLQFWFSGVRARFWFWIGKSSEAELLSTFRSHDEVINPRFVWL